MRVQPFIRALHSAGQQMHADLLTSPPTCLLLQANEVFHDIPQFCAV